jgi:hypothetical protein
LSNKIQKIKIQNNKKIGVHLWPQWVAFHGGDFVILNLEGVGNI